MSAYTPAIQTEVLALLDALREEVITSEDRDRLYTLVANYEEAKSLYCEYVLLASALRWSQSATGESGPQSDNSIALPSRHPSIPWSRRPIRGFLARSTAAISRPVFWATLAAGVLFAGYVVTISWNMLGNEAGDWRLEAGVGSQDPTAYSLQPTASVATITDTSDAQWPDAPNKSEIPNPQSAIAVGEPLALTSGLVELQLKQGATLLVEGPAEWSIDGENRATLKHGKLFAHVPEQAVGFTLTTPAATIIDLGTEFGVDVRPTNTEVHVLEGSVNARIESKAAADQSMRLAKGEAIRVETAGTGVYAVTSMSANRQHFAESLSRPARNGTVTIQTRIEAGDGSYDYVFPTIPSPSGNDLADASRKITSIRAIGELHRSSGPVEYLIDGHGAREVDGRAQHVLFNSATTGMYLLDLGTKVRVQHVNTYSWHMGGKPEGVPQIYELYGSAADKEPSTDGFLTSQGWRRIATVNTEKMLGSPPDCRVNKA